MKINYTLVAFFFSLILSCQLEDIEGNRIKKGSLDDGTYSTSQLNYNSKELSFFTKSVAFKNFLQNTTDEFTLANAKTIDYVNNKNHFKGILIPLYDNNNGSKHIVAFYTHGVEISKIYSLQINHIMGEEKDNILYSYELKDDKNQHVMSGKLPSFQDVIIYIAKQL